MTQPATPLTIPPVIDASLTHTLTALIPTLEGWSSVDKCQWLARLAYHTATDSTIPDPVSVELGVFGGRGLVALALGHWLARRGIAMGIDPYTVAATQEGTNAPENDRWWAQVDLPAIAQRCRTTLRTVIPDPSYWLLGQIDSRTAAQYVAQAVFPYHGPVQVLHQDSNHSEEISRAEVALWWPLMAPGGWWIMDDVNWPSTQAAQQDLVDRGARVWAEGDGTWRIYQIPAGS